MPLLRKLISTYTQILLHPRSNPLLRKFSCIQTKSLFYQFVVSSVTRYVPVWFSWDPYQSNALPNHKILSMWRHCLTRIEVISLIVQCSQYRLAICNYGNSYCSKWLPKNQHLCMEDAGLIYISSI